MTTETWTAATFMLAAASAAGSCASIALKLKMDNRIMLEFDKLRKELGLTYFRKDIWDVAEAGIERRLNRLEGCRGPT